MERQRVAVIGMGRLGCALHASWTELGLDVVGLGREEGGLSSKAARRKLEHADVLSVCVQDDRIPAVMAELHGIEAHGKLVLLHSGTLPMDVLDDLADAGADIAKLHPLRSFTRPQRIPIPAGTHFALTGTDSVAARLIEWITAWRGVPHRLTQDQWLPYHLAAVLAANFLPLLIRSGADLLRPMAEQQRDALAWLEPLVKSAVHAALDVQNAKPYSGPAVRGDWRIIENHLTHLEEHHPQLALVYRAASELLNARANVHL